MRYGPAAGGTQLKVADGLQSAPGISTYVPVPLSNCSKRYSAVPVQPERRLRVESSTIVSPTQKGSPRTTTWASAVQLAAQAGMRRWRSPEPSVQRTAVGSSLHSATAKLKSVSMTAVTSGAPGDTLKKHVRHSSESSGRPALAPRQ